MATDNWRYPVNGDWDDASRWTTGVPTAAADAAITSFGSYTVSLSGAETFNTLAVLDATLVEGAKASITSAGLVELDNNETDLNADNAGLTGTVNAINGEIVVGHADALGSAQVRLSAGSELLATTSMALANPLTIPAALYKHVVIAAAAHRVLTLDGTLAVDGLIQFGAADATGTVVLAPTSAANQLGYTPFTVAGGTLQFGSAQAASLLGSPPMFASPLTLSGATLDLNGFGATLGGGDNQGLITSSGGSTAALALGGDITGGGTIGGNITLTLTGTTPVHVQGALALTGLGGLSLVDQTDSNGDSEGQSLIVSGPVSIARGGSLSIDADSTLEIDGAATLAAPIRLAGTLDLKGNATITGSINGGNLLASGAGVTVTLSGAGTVSAIAENGATLVLAHAGAADYVAELNANIVLQAADAVDGEAQLAGGALTALAGGTLVGLDVFDDSNLSVAHGQTLDIIYEFSFENDLVQLTIGSPGNDGTVILDAPTDAATHFGSVLLADGTLRIGPSASSNFDAVGLTVAAGATLDLAGHSFTVIGLQGAGSVTSRSAATLGLVDADFAGVISGKLGVEVNHEGELSPTSILSGDNSFTGTTTIDAGATLTLGAGGTTGSVASTAIVDNGTLAFDHANALTIRAALSGSGNLDQLGTGTTTIAGSNPGFSGVALVEQGALVFGGRIDGADVFVIDAGATLEFVSKVDADAGAFFNAGGTLRLDDAHDFAGLLHGFGEGETIDLAGFAVAGETVRWMESGDGVGGTLRIKSGAQTALLNFAEDHSRSHFHLADDGHGGTLLTYDRVIPAMAEMIHGG